MLKNSFHLLTVLPGPQTGVPDVQSKSPGGRDEHLGSERVCRAKYQEAISCRPDGEANWIRGGTTE